MQNIYLKEASKKLGPIQYTLGIYIFTILFIGKDQQSLQTLTLTSELFNQNMQMPFYDIKLQDFLSIMPKNLEEDLILTQQNIH